MKSGYSLLQRNFWCAAQSKNYVYRSLFRYIQQYSSSLYPSFSGIYWLNSLQKNTPFFTLLVFFPISRSNYVNFGACHFLIWYAVYPLYYWDSRISCNIDYMSRLLLILVHFLRIILLFDSKSVKIGSYVFWTHHFLRSCLCAA